jgi:hypothetical protein
MRPSATSIYGLTLLVYAALSFSCMRPEATRASCLKLLVCEAFSYLYMQEVQILELSLVFSYLYMDLSYLCMQEVQMLELSLADYLGVMRYAVYLLYWY